MNYTLHQLRVFIKIAETGSITKAAEDLQLTQPAVSVQLKNLQDQFNIALTETIGRKIHLTDFGREIVKIAEQIIEQVETIQQKTLSYQGLLVGKLKISVVSTGKYVIPFFLTDFIKRHSGVDLIVDVTNKSKVIESLESNEVDLALVSILPVKLKVEKLDLLQNKMYLVGNKPSLFKKDETLREHFKQLPLIFREPGSGTRQMMEGFIQKNKLVVNKKLELTSNEAVKQAVLAGLGYSIMPIIGIKNEIQNKELQIIPIRGLPIKTTWSLIWLKGKKHNPIVTTLLDYLKKEKTNIINEKFKWYEDY